MAPLSLRRRFSTGVTGPLALLGLLTLVTLAIVTVIIAANRDPARTEPAANLVAPPQLDRIQRGATEAQVRSEFGEPARVVRDAAATDRCLIYENVTATQRVYRFCFNGDRLVEFSPQ